MKRLLLSFCVVLTLSGCLILDGSFTDSEIVSFSFMSDTNTGLRKSYHGTIDEDSRAILIDIPNYMDVTKLIATFEFDGVVVTVNGAPQESGVTVQDFSGPVEYTVRGKDDKSEKYIVRSTVVPPSSDTSIYILGIGFDTNAVFSRVDADNSTIELIDIYGITQNSTLYLSFQTEGIRVTANGARIYASAYSYYRYGEYPSNFLDFSGPINITVYAEDGTEKTYAIVKKIGFGP